MRSAIAFAVCLLSALSVGAQTPLKPPKETVLDRCTHGYVASGFRRQRQPDYSSTEALITMVRIFVEKAK